MSRVCVCITVAGSASYFQAARLAIRSVLGRSPFDVFVAAGAGPARLLPCGPRVTTQAIESFTAVNQRAFPFLLKFAALKACLATTRAEFVILLDVDALLAAPVDDATVEAALGAGGLGMVEQTAIRGSILNRSGFLDHYLDHTLSWFDPSAPPPPLERFRYYNGGVVLGHRDELARLAGWAEDRIRGAASHHHVGRHMISDQDYFQFWANQLSPDACVELPWQWNHCEHWDEGFPRSGALVLHFSNFCNGPGARQRARMRMAGWRLAWSLT